MFEIFKISPYRRKLWDKKEELEKLKREEEILETEKEIETLKNKLNYPTEAS
jgi:cell division protein FtsB